MNLVGDTGTTSRRLLPLSLTLAPTPVLFSGEPVNIQLASPFIVLVGPNASGKTHALKRLADALRNVQALSASLRVRLLASGRTGPLESFRANLDPNSLSGHPASVGHKSYTDRWWLSESVTGDFLTMMERADLRLKLEARLQDLFSRSLLLEWTPSGLQVGFRPTKGGQAYYANVEASGLLHLLSLLASTYNDQIGALLVDEPEISLHPQLQAFVLQEMLDAAGDPLEHPGKKLILLATHSTSMLPLRSMQDIANVVFFSERRLPPRQVPATAGELRSSKLAALVARMSHSHRTAFFAQTVLLVEGPSDEIVVTGLAQHLDHSLLANNAQIVPVIGKGEFPETIKFFHLMGKRTVALCDLDAISDTNDVVAAFSHTDEAIKAANNLGAARLLDLDRALRAELADRADRSWGEIETLAAAHPYWRTREPSISEVNAKRRAVLATLLTTPDEQLTDITNGEAWVALKVRFVALLEALEKSGCFVLRRGTIENYYSPFASMDLRAKPQAAAAEVACWTDGSLPALQARYADVVRAMHCAAPVKCIDENRLLRMKLAAAVGALFQVMQTDTPDDDLNSQALSTIGSDASIFKFENKSAPGTRRLRINLSSTLFKSSAFPFEVGEGDNLTALVRDKLPGPA